MSLITDIRAVSENAVEQIAARFGGLPRPVLAAIGAGDMALERFADLRESLSDSIGERVPTPSIDITDVRSAASDLGSKVSDLPSRAQKVAADVAGTIEQFAAEAPAKAQEFIAQMPEKVAEFQVVAQSLSPDAVQETVEAYSHLFGMIYGNLADRGDKTWTRMRATGVHPGAVAEAVAAKAGPVARAAVKLPVRAAARARPTRTAAPTVAAPTVATPAVPTPKAGPRTAAAPVAAKSGVMTPTAAKPAPVKPATVKPVAVKPVAVRPVAVRPVAVKPAAAKPVAAKPVAMKPVAAKPAPAKPAKRPVTKSADKVVPKAAPKFITAKQTVRRSAGRTTVMPVVETVVIHPETPES